MAGRVPITVTVNGQLHAGEVEPRLLLVHFLRDTLGLTGTHVGCDTSNCGACTVHLDGEAVKSCTVLAVQADGAEVTTIEGMGSEGDLHPLQEAFWEHHGLQCGYCTPGMIMAGADLLAATRTRPRRRSARRSRATSAAVPATTTSSRRSCPRRAREVTAVSADRASRAPTAKWVGQALRRKEDPRLITGRGRYVDDMVVPGMLYMAVVRSPEAHAKIVSIDTSGAEERPASTASSPARTSTSPPACRWRGCRRASRSRRPSTGRSPRARSSTSARPSPSWSATTSTRVVDAAEQVLVEYDPLPVVIDPEKALEDGSPLVHPDLGTNQTHEWSLGGGDIDAAWAEADVVIERRIVNHRTAGAAIEPRVLHRRLPRRAADAAPHQPDPAPHPPVHGRRARDLRGQASA